LAIYRWLNLIGFIAMVAVNIAAENLPLGGKTTGEISAQYPVLITPAGYAFLIWTIIYFLLLLYVVYGFTKPGRESKMNQAVSVFFFVSCLLNIGWLVAWHYEKLASSVFVMLALLFALITIHIRIKDAMPQFAVPADRWLVRLPFSIYLSWISVAFIVNIAVTLYASEWDRFGLSELAWTIMMLSAAVLIAIITTIKETNIAFAAVFIWAFFAIGVKQLAYPAVAYTSFAYVILLIASVIWLIMRKKQEQGVTAK